MDPMVLDVAIKMESAPASQTFLATNVNNVWMDSIDFQTVKVGFLSILLKWILLQKQFLTLLHRMQV